MSGVSSERAESNRFATTIAVFAVLYLLAAWSLAYVFLGVIRASTLMSVLEVGALLGAAFLWLTAVVALAVAVRELIRKRYSGAHGLLFAAALAFASPLVARSTTTAFVRRAELRDLERVGVDALRNEAAALVVVSKNKQYPQRYFGAVVPRGDLPPKIRELSIRASYVAAGEEAIVLSTDGIASWRGGYLITPTGSTFIPAESRQITDGIFYVTAR